MLALPPLAGQGERQRGLDDGTLRQLLRTLLGVAERCKDALNLPEVEHRERSPAVAAGGCGREVDRCAAVRAVHRTHLRLELGELHRRERPDERFLAQEIENVMKRPWPLRHRQ